MIARPGLELRAAAAADAPGMAELLASAGLSVPPAVLAARIEALRQGAGAVLLALEWGPPSGLIVLHWYGALERPLLVAQITLLLVGEDARRRGIGRLLVKAASQAARVAGCGTLECLAGPGQAALAGFCTATGFAEDGQRFARALRKNAH